MMATSMSALTGITGGYTDNSTGQHLSRLGRQLQYAKPSPGMRSCPGSALTITSRNFLSTPLRGSGAGLFGPVWFRLAGRVCGALLEEKVTISMLSTLVSRLRTAAQA